MLLLQILILHAFAHEQGHADSKDVQLSFAQPRRRTLNCRGADDGCGANGNGELGLGMGDCDRDADCAGSLVCTAGACPWGDNDDCCTAQGCTCDRQGAKNEWCRVTGNDGGCGLAGYLTEGMGDCDRDSDCVGDLVCQNGACPWGDNDDCCVKPRNNELHAACEFRIGDGTGGSEEKLTGTYDTARECADEVWKSRPTANGATWGVSNKKCYAEYGQNGLNTNGNLYYNCKFIDWWKVTKGPCKISGSNGNCITTPNYPDYYDNEECDFQVASFGRFQIEDWHVNDGDYFQWNNWETLNFRDPDNREDNYRLGSEWSLRDYYSDYYKLRDDVMGMHLVAGENKFRWRPDGSSYNTGFKLCLDPPRMECTGNYEEFKRVKKSDPGLFDSEAYYIKVRATAWAGSRCTSKCYKSVGKRWGDSWRYVDGYHESRWGAECGAQYCDAPDSPKSRLYDGTTRWGRAEEALADAFEVALPEAQDDSPTTPHVVLHAFAALGVAVLAYGAFKYYIKKNADYQEVGSGKAEKANTSAAAKADAILLNA